MEQRYRLKQIRNGLGLSQAQFALKINYPLSTISAIEAGNQKLPMRLAYMLQDIILKDTKGNLRVSSEDYPRTDDEVSLRAEWLFRGTGKPFDEDLIINSHQKIKINIINKETSVQIDISGDINFFQLTDASMSPLFSKNDIVALNTQKKEVVSGNIYLIRLFGENLIRTIYKINSSEYNVVAENVELVPTLAVGQKDIEILGEYDYMLRIKE